MLSTPLLVGESKSRTIAPRAASTSHAYSRYEGPGSTERSHLPCPMWNRPTIRRHGFWRDLWRAFLNLWFAKPTFCNPRGFQESNEDHERTKTIQTTANKRDDCLISGHHGNNGNNDKTTGNRGFVSSARFRVPPKNGGLAETRFFIIVRSVCCAVLADPPLQIGGHTRSML